MGRPTPRSKVFHGFGAFLGLALAYSNAAHAQESVAVLGVEATDGAPNTIATTITDAMRQKVSSSKDFKLVPGRDLVEVKLVFSCPDEAPSCMAEAAKSLGADNLIFGSVKKAPGGSYLVTLKLISAGSAKVEAYIAEQLDKNQATGPGIRGPVQKWFADLTGRGATGTIRVSANTIGASILLDGQPVGMTQEKPVDLENIASGEHEVLLSKPGHRAVKQSVTVATGAVVQVSGELASTEGQIGEASLDGETPADVTETSSADTDKNTGLKFAAWSTAGAGVVSLILAIKFGVDTNGINSDLDPYRRYKCSDSVSGVCDFKGDPVDANDVKLSDEDSAKVQAWIDDGDQAELLQYIFYGSSVVLLGTSAYLFYTAYLADDAGTEVAHAGGARSGRRTSASARTLPTLTPYFGPQGTGVSAHWSF